MTSSAAPSSRPTRSADIESITTIIAWGAQSESLEHCFGHNIVKRSLAEDGNDTKIARENKTLYVDGLTGGLKTAPSQTTKKVGGHTFFGN